MIFHFTVFFWSVVFYMGLQAILYLDTDTTWSWYFFSITFLILIVSIGVKKITGRIRDWFLPALFAVTTPTLLSFIDNKTEQQIFVFLASVMVYTAFMGAYRLKQAPKDLTAIAFLQSAALAGLFLFYGSMYGFYLNFTFPLWALMVLFFIGTTFTSFATLVPDLPKVQYPQAKLYSALLGLTLTELAWVVSFWPFGYLTTGTISLIFFYISWDIAWQALRGSLTLKRTLFRMFFFFALVALLLVSTPWRILV
jgi:hypothetical protein